MVPIVVDSVVNDLVDVTTVDSVDRLDDVVVYVSVDATVVDSEIGDVEATILDNIVVVVSLVTILVIDSKGEIVIEYVDEEMLLIGWVDKVVVRSKVFVGSVDTIS